MHWLALKTVSRRQCGAWACAGVRRLHGAPIVRRSVAATPAPTRGGPLIARRDAVRGLAGLRADVAAVSLTIAANEAMSGASEAMPTPSAAIVGVVSGVAVGVWAAAGAANARTARPAKE